MIKAVIFDYNGVLNKFLRQQKDIYDLANNLKSKGYKIAVLSNLISPIGWYLKKRGDFKGFDPVIISSDVGMVKPDPEIFKLALTKLGLRPNECVFIDDRARNVKSASSIGIHTIRAKSPNQIISDLSEIINI